MLKSMVHEQLSVQDVAVQEYDWVPTGTQVFTGQQSGRLAMDDAALDRLLTGKTLTAQKFARRRLKFLLHRCSKEVREGRLSVAAVNRLSDFCLEIIPLIENASIVMPTATEISVLIDWYLAMQTRSGNESPVVLTTVCPDYPYEWRDTKAMFKNGLVGDDIGLIGESIVKTGPQLLHILSKSLNMPFTWIVGYAGFEAKTSNLQSMNISAEEFWNRLEKSALKLGQKINTPVGILPVAAGVTMEQFRQIRESFNPGDFTVRRKGMDALSAAVDARDWASIFHIAAQLNAIIVDGASVYMGRKAYKKAKQILQPVNHTPSFYCVTPYLGFAG